MIFSCRNKSWFGNFKTFYKSLLYMIPLSRNTFIGDFFSFNQVFEIRLKVSNGVFWVLTPKSTGWMSTSTCFRIYWNREKIKTQPLKCAISIADILTKSKSITQSSNRKWFFWFALFLYNERVTKVKKAVTARQLF